MHESCALFDLYSANPGRVFLKESVTHVYHGICVLFLFVVCFAFLCWFYHMFR